MSYALESETYECCKIYIVAQSGANVLLKVLPLKRINFLFRKYLWVKLDKFYWFSIRRYIRRISTKSKTRSNSSGKFEKTQFFNVVGKGVNRCPSFLSGTKIRLK